MNTNAKEIRLSKPWFSTENPHGYYCYLPSEIAQLLFPAEEQLVSGGSLVTEELTAIHPSVQKFFVGPKDQDPWTQRVDWGGWLHYVASNMFKESNTNQK